jgi:tricarballylate dehydrogenase
MSSTTAEQVAVVVVGGGVAGLSAAVSAAEALRGKPGRVVLVDRGSPEEAGGNTRWTSAYFRLDDLYEPGPNFVSDLAAFSDGRTPEAYVRRLVELLPESMEWIQGHGVRFKTAQTYFINSSRKRLQPVGGGESIVRTLTQAASDLRVDIRYRTVAEELVVSRDGVVTGVVVTDGDGVTRDIAGDAVIIASGGFEGNPELLSAELGPKGVDLRQISPGGQLNRGEGITMGLCAGAKRAGEWDNFHAEPVDPRSGDPEALVMVFPYGILVNRAGRRFVDEGRGTVDETYESTSRAIWREDGSLAYFITDQHFDQVSDRARGILTGEKPVVADSVAELATALGLPAEELLRTVEEFNESIETSAAFDWRTPDGRKTTGIEPAKSNWAVPLVAPPFLAYPVTCAIVFTFGGLATDDLGRVLDDADEPIPGLFAAGECTGIYFGKYPGGTSVMRGLVYGRLAALTAVRQAPSSAADSSAGS